MSALNGGPAFPWREEDGAGGYDQHVGMSLRDWFAGQAMNGFISASTNRDVLSKLSAQMCYDMADAMLAVRAKTEGEK
jgi:hypothetical protein